MKRAETVLLHNLKSGDHNAFEQIFEQYCERLFQFSFSYLKSKEAAEDVVQEVFIKVWKNRNGIKTDASFQSYLFKITLNTVREHFNKLSRSFELKHELVLGLTENDQNPDEVLDYQHMLDELEGLIDKMPEKRKEAFVKKKIEGKSLKEVADEMKVTTKAVEYHITEAMKFLKAEFEAMKIRGLIFYHLFLSY
ncbi:MAG: RNA polymerase sigma factor [Mangrovibacterium sp.]